jgi:hypothetical protein
MGENDFGVVGLRQADGERQRSLGMLGPVDRQQNHLEHRNRQ